MYPPLYDIKIIIPEKTKTTHHRHYGTAGAQATQLLLQEMTKHPVDVQSGPATLSRFRLMILLRTPQRSNMPHCPNPLEMPGINHEYLQHHELTEGEGHGGAGGEAFWDSEEGLQNILNIHQSWPKVKDFSKLNELLNKPVCYNLPSNIKMKMKKWGGVGNNRDS